MIKLFQTIEHDFFLRKRKQILLTDLWPCGSGSCLTCSRVRKCLDEFEVLLQEHSTAVCEAKYT